MPMALADKAPPLRTMVNRAVRDAAIQRGIADLSKGITGLAAEISEELVTQH